MSNPDTLENEPIMRIFHNYQLPKERLNFKTYTIEETDMKFRGM
jgi:hypothetical protein